MSDDLRRFERSHLWVGHVEDITNERDALRQALAEAAQSFVAIRKLILPILRGEDRDVVDIAEIILPALARIRDILGGEND